MKSEKKELSEDQATAYRRIRRAGVLFAEAVLENTPRSAKQAAILGKIEEAVLEAREALSKKSDR